MEEENPIILNSEEIENISKAYYNNRQFEFQIIKTHDGQWDCNIFYESPSKKLASSIANFLSIINNPAPVTGNINDPTMEDLIRTCLIKLGVKDKVFLEQVLQYFERNNRSVKKSRPAMKPSQTFKQG